MTRQPLKYQLDKFSTIEESMGAINTTNQGKLVAHQQGSTSLEKQLWPIAFWILADDLGIGDPAYFRSANTVNIFKKGEDSLWALQGREASIYQFW